MMRKAVITGPTGVIGRALINKCIQEKIRVLAICRKNSLGINNLPKSEYLKVIECNLDKFNDLEIIDKYDVFYHFAWNGTFGDSRNNLYIQNSNIQYTLDAVHLAEKLGCHTFIGAGSQAECGRFEGKLNGSTPANPENGYGIAKLCAGQMSRVLCQQLDMKHIWTRILSVYGPYDDEKTMIMSTIMKLKNGEVPQFTKGEQLWDYLYSDDAALAMYLLASKGQNGKVYCIGSGEAKPLHEYINTLRDLIDSKLQIDLGAVPYSENQVMHLCADIEELKVDTGFSPTIDFAEGIKELLNYIKCSNS